MLRIENRRCFSLYMSRSASRRAILQRRVEEENLVLSVADVYCVLQAIPKRTSIEMKALLNLRMCSPVVMRSADAGSDGVVDSLTPLLVDYLNTLAPAEMMLIRNRDGDVFSPLFESPSPYEDVDWIECESCGCESLPEDFVSCCGGSNDVSHSDEPSCRSCRQCFAGFADDSLRNAQPMQCGICWCTVDPWIARRELCRIGLDSIADQVCRVIQSKEHAETQFECPVHPGVTLVVKQLPTATRDDVTCENVNGACEAYCEHCCRLWCKECLQRGHKGMTCAEARDAAAKDPTVPIRQKLENMLVSRCPCCTHPLGDFGEGECFALTCLGCSGKFCAFCYAACGSDAHAHVMTCAFRRQNFPQLPDSYFFDHKYYYISSGIRVRPEIEKLLATIEDKKTLQRVCDETLPLLLRGHIYEIDVDAIRALFVPG
jgi:hypothetical protein